MKHQLLKIINHPRFQTAFAAMAITIFVLQVFGQSFDAFLFVICAALVLIQVDTVHPELKGILIKKVGKGLCRGRRAYFFEIAGRHYAAGFFFIARVPF